MKKFLYTLVALSAVATLAFSCAKELTTPENDINEPVVNSNLPMTIEAIINPDDVQTKTQYTGNTTFGWKSGDNIRLAVVDGDKWGFSTYSTSATDGSTTATFTAGSYNLDNNAHANSSGYAIYPNSVFQFSGWAASGTWDDKNGHPLINLPTSIAYNSTAPLDGGVIPLIGRKDGETYKFSTAVGIIKLTLNNAPAAGNKIKLVSTGKPIAGKFAVSDVSSTVSQVANTSAAAGTYELTLTGLSLTAGESYDFYFPLPVGTYDAGTLSICVLDAYNAPLHEQTIAKSLTISRNEILSLPALLYHRVYVDGTLSAPQLHTVKPSTASRIRVHISTEKLTPLYYEQHYNEWRGGNFFSDATASFNLATLWNKDESSYLLTAPGEYYLQYVILKSGYNDIPSSLKNNDNVLIYGSVPFTFAPAANKIPIASSWLNVPYVSTAEGAVANLVDGAINNYWHSPYGSEDPARNATYGQIISIDLNEGGLTTDGNLYFSFCTRSGAENNHAKALNVYVSDFRWDEAGFDAAKVLVGSTENALVGIDPYNGVWIKNPIICSGSGSYRYITISILSNSLGYDLRTSGCTHMAEIEFYTK